MLKTRCSRTQFLEHNYFTHSEQFHKREMAADICL